VAGGTLIDTLRYEIELDAQRAVGQIPGLIGSVGRIGPVALGAAAGIATIGAVAVPALKKATDEAKKFETAWAEVRTIMSGSPAESAAMAQSILDLSTAIPEDAVSLAKAYYEVLSAGSYTATEAQTILAASSKAAIAGVTGTAVAVDAVTTIMNSYGKSADQAEDILDGLFLTVKEGKIEFDEIASGIGKAVPFFAAGKVPIEELNAAIATLTKGGIGPEEAMTSLKNVIVAIVKPSDEAAAKAKELGIEFNAEALAAKGLVGFLNEVKEKTQGSAKAQAELFGDIRSLLAVMSLAGKQSAEFNRQTELQEKRAGTVNEAYKKVNETLAAQEQILKNRVTAAWVALGNAFLPVRKSFVDGLNDMFGDSLNESTEALEAQAKAMVATRRDAETLATRYRDLQKELSSVNPVSKEYVEIQERLKKVIKELADRFPGIATAIDEQNRAMEISIPLLEKQVALQERLFLFQSGQNTKKIGDEFMDLQRRLAREQQALDRFRNPTRVTGAAGGGTFLRAANPDLLYFEATEKNLEKFGERAAKSAQQFIDDWKAAEDQVKRTNIEIDAVAASLLRTAKAQGVGDLIGEFVAVSEKLDAGAASVAEYDAAFARIQKRAPELASVLHGFPALVERIGGVMEEQAKKADAATVPEETPTPQAEAAYIARGRAFAQAIQRGMDEEFAREVSAVLGMSLTPEEVAEMKESMGELWSVIEEQIEQRRKAEERAAEAIRDLYEKAFKEATERGFANLPKVLREQLDEAISGGKIDLTAAVRISGIDPLPDEFKEKWADLQLTVGSVSDSVRDDVLGFLEGQKSVGQVMGRLAGVSEDVRDSILNGVVRPLLQMSKVNPDDMQAIVDIIIRQAKTEAERIERQRTIIKQTQEWAFLLQSAGDLLFDANDGMAKLIGHLQGLNQVIGYARAGDLVGILGAAMSTLQGIVGSLFGGDESAARAAERARFMEKTNERIARSLEELIDRLSGDTNTAIQNTIRNMEAAGGLVPDIADAYTNLQKAIKGGNRAEIAKAQDEYEKLFGAIKGFFEAAGIEIDLNAFRGHWDELAKIIDEALDGARNAILDFALFTSKTFEGMNSKLDYLFDNLDIDEPAEQLSMILAEFKKLTGIDMTGLASLTPDKFNEVIEGFVELLTMDRKDIESLFGIFDGTGGIGDIAKLHQNPAYKVLLDISKVLGLSLPEVVKMFQSLLLDSGLTGEEVQNFIDHLEDIGDELADRDVTEVGDETIGVARRVEITEAQGATIISNLTAITAAGQSARVAIDRAVGYLAEIAGLLKSRSTAAAAAGGGGNLQFGDIIIHASSPEAGRVAAGAFILDVEERVRAYGLQTAGGR
jgi:TP901 family phage tail tape measure protein